MNNHIKEYFKKVKFYLKEKYEVDLNLVKNELDDYLNNLEKHFNDQKDPLILNIEPEYFADDVYEYIIKSQLKRTNS